MEIEWDLVSQSMLDQLSMEDSVLVKSAVHDAVIDWEHVRATRLVGAWNDENVFVLRAGKKFRVVVSRKPDRMTVLDVIPERQIEALRQMLGGTAQA
jgi:hypothetical protein